MKNSEPKYWFPAKQYGWGWGPPVAWQGWLVLLAFSALMVAGIFVFPPQRGPLIFMLYTLVLCIALVAVCYLKGEPPAWRWGKK